MPKINEKQAKEFLDNINENDKVAIIHHDDLDGFASGILFYDFCKNKNVKEIKTLVFSYNTLDKNYFKEELKNCNKVLIGDIAPSGINKIKEAIKNKEIFYTDHHPKDTEVPKEILELRFENKYIPSSRTTQELTNLKKWLGVAGTIADAGERYEENQEYINNFLEDNNFELENFKNEIVFPISNLLIYFENNLKKAFEILIKIKNPKDLENIKKYSNEISKEINYFYEKFEKEKEVIGKMNLFYCEPTFKTRSAIISKISYKYPEKIFILATPDKNKKINLSARNQSRDFDVAEISRNAIKNFPESFAGGHKAAAGGNIRQEDFQKFKENLKKYFEKQE